MKKHFWLILAVISLLGMIIMPTMANSAVIRTPIALPTVIAPRISLPNYPVPQISITPRIQLPTPQLNPSWAPIALPAPTPMAPAAAAPFLAAGLAAVPVTNHPVSQIAPIPGSPASNSAARDMLKKISQAGRLPDSRKFSALFDGAAAPQGAPVVLASQEGTPVQQPKADDESLAATEKGDSHLTLPEWDLEQEIGIGY